MIESCCHRGLRSSGISCGLAGGAGETIEALFADPHAALLSELSLCHQITETVPLWRTLVAEPRSLRSLRASNLGDGAAQLDALTQLEALWLAGSASFGPLDALPVSPATRVAHANLRSLNASARACPAAITGDIDAPRLERFEWVLRDFDDPDELGLELFSTPTSLLYHPPPTLRELTVSGGAALDMLVALPVFAQLRTLGWHSDHTLERVLELAPALQHLESLSLSPAPFAHLPAEAVTGLREQMERAFPSTVLAISWDAMVERSEPRRNAEPRRPTSVDADSRDDQGRMNALARFTQNPRR